MAAGTRCEQRLPPSNWYVFDEEAREVTEQLDRDAGYDPCDSGICPAPGISRTPAGSS
jgi:hypothetical protein